MPLGLASTASLASAAGEKTPPFRQDAYRWNQGRYSRQRRFVDIWGFMLRLLWARWLYGKAWSYGGPITAEAQTARRRELAVWIRETLLDLGPTFIKVGQLFSTRADIFPSSLWRNCLSFRIGYRPLAMSRPATLLRLT
jgi:hypothetical protein